MRDGRDICGCILMLMLESFGMNAACYVDNSRIGNLSDCFQRARYDEGDAEEDWDVEGEYLRNCCNSGADVEDHDVSF